MIATDSSSTSWSIAVITPTPQHSVLDQAFSYIHESALQAGTLLRVPLGNREVLGMVWQSSSLDERNEASAYTLRPISGVLEGLPPLPPHWLRLIAFSARYYQRSLGEMALASLPPQLRTLDSDQLQRRLQRKTRVKTHAAYEADADAAAPGTSESALDLSTEQAAAAAAILKPEALGPFLLHGSTGSGKTEVYLHCVQQLLDADPNAQALVMVPEINLTPQLEARFQARFTPRYGAQAVVSMHSGMTPAQRLQAWLAAHMGQARIVLGTRMAVFASLPGLRLIIVDEEHDPSYKQQEGARYSARDLAIWRGHDLKVRVVLGSATPSLESWYASRPEGRYVRLAMPSRIGTARLPKVRRVDMRQQPKRTVFSPPLLEAMAQRLQRGEQCLVLLNRRGYAPVLHCADCDWKSNCPHCSTFQVFYKSDRSLRCHHCGITQRVPHFCPSCGSPEIQPIGKGTEQLEEQLAALLHNTPTAHGGPVRILRIDADSSRGKGMLEEQLAQVHAGEVDVLIGTQMVAKGHDFRRMTLVAAVQPDGALFSSDFRAPERLFSLLMQAAGRAGRDAAYMTEQGSTPEMWVQTSEPEHALYKALRQHDYAAFAEQELLEREGAGMPPFAFQALLRADARTQEAALAFLTAARDMALAQALPGQDHLCLFPPIPLTVQRVAGVERAQLLIESDSRPALQQFLVAWQPVLHQLRKLKEHKGVIRWLVDVDPIAI